MNKDLTMELRPSLLPPQFPEFNLSQQIAQMYTIYKAWSNTVKTILTSALPTQMPLPGLKPVLSIICPHSSNYEKILKSFQKMSQLSKEK